MTSGVLLLVGRLVIDGGTGGVRIEEERDEGVPGTGRGGVQAERRITVARHQHSTCNHTRVAVATSPVKLACLCFMGLVHVNEINQAVRGRLVSAINAGSGTKTGFTCTKLIDVCLIRHVSHHPPTHRTERTVAVTTCRDSC